MSIAVSVLVRPSPGLRVLHAGLCCCVTLSAAACPGVWAPLLCGLAGVLGYVAGRPRGIAVALDISGVARFRVAVYLYRTARPTATLRLLDGSTLWRDVLVLRLGDDHGNVHSLLVLPDCVTGAEWRALSLACRAAAARSEINTPAP